MVETAEMIILEIVVVQSTVMEAVVVLHWLKVIFSHSQ